MTVTFRTLLDDLKEERPADHSPQSRHGRACTDPCESKLSAAANRNFKPPVHHARLYRRSGKAVHLSVLSKKLRGDVALTRPLSCCR